MGSPKTAAKTVELPKALQTAPTAEAAPAKPEKKTRVRVQYTELFDSAEAAVKEASTRTKGPRRAFEVKWQDKTYYVVHNNEGRAAGVVGLKLGFQVQEIGRAKRSAKPQGVEALMAAINSLPESERAAIMAQLKG